MARREVSIVDRGSATLLLVLSAALLGSVALAIGHVGGVLVHHQRAQNAADAAALAAVIGGRQRAEFVAATYGASVVELIVGDGTAVVTVECGNERAQARATNRP